MFHDVCTKAAVPQLRVHDLRHSYATLLSRWAFSQRQCSGFCATALLP
jgi:integrase